MNTKVLLPLLLGTACLMASCRNQEMIPVDEISSLAVKQCTIMEQSLTEDTMPRNFQNGELVLSDTHWWCSGFFPGVCWYTYKLSGEEAMKEMALKESAKLLDVSGLSGDHDLGFQVLPLSGCLVVNSYFFILSGLPCLLNCRILLYTGGLFLFSVFSGYGGYT